jgi:hypothetical protein
MLAGAPKQLRAPARRLACLAGLLAVSAGAPAEATSLYLSADVPIPGGTGGGPPFFSPNQIVRSDEGALQSVVSLARDAAIDGLYRRDDGAWLISIAAPADLGGALRDPRSVLIYDGSTYTLLFDGAAEGVPAGVNVDTVRLASNGDLILGFDVPTTLDGTDFEPADLARFAGGTFSLELDASSTTPPIPATSNVTGADIRGSTTVLTFDVPTTLGTETFQPGDLVGWDGSGFSLFFRDPGWDEGARINGFSLVRSPGVIGATLTVTKLDAAPPEELQLSWGPSCLDTATDYGIWEGTLNEWYSHSAVDCEDDEGDLTEQITAGSGDRYFLVAPLSGSYEGGLGEDSTGAPRPRGPSPRCRPERLIEPCP